MRKAALVALSTLLELFPAEPSLCQAWVASVLPLVRDVEVAVQVMIKGKAALLTRVSLRTSCKPAGEKPYCVLDVSIILTVACMLLCIAASMHVLLRQCIVCRIPW